MDTNHVKKIGKYEIKRILGRGGMGSVYLGVDERIGREVAIKTLTDVSTGQPEMLKMFYREARAGFLQHPNIVAVYDMGEEDGLPYIVMEFAKGESLKDIISSRVQPPLIEKLTIIDQVCSALGYAHAQGVVHRDVKPANVNVKRDPILAKLMDFGIAKVESAKDLAGLTRTGNVIGTINYMAPERLRGQQGDGRVDLFATGVMLYELLTERIPFAAESDAAIMQKLLYEPFPPLSNYLSNYPLQLDSILERALAKEREVRYQTAEEFSADLRSVIETLKKGEVADLLESAQRLINNQQFDSARDLLNQIVRIDPQHDHARRMLREVNLDRARLQRTEQVRMALQSAEEAIAAGHHQIALNLLETAVAEDPDNASIKVRIAEVKEIIAEVNRQTAKGDRIKGLLARMERFRGWGDRVGAQGCLDEALALDPENKELLAVRSQLSQEADSPTPQSSGSAAGEFTKKLMLSLSGASEQPGKAEVPPPSTEGSVLPVTIFPNRVTGDFTVLMPQFETRILRSDSPEDNRFPAAFEASQQRQQPVGDIGSFTAIFQHLSSEPMSGKAEAPTSVSASPSFNSDQQRPRVVCTVSESTDNFLRGVQVEISAVPFTIGRSAEANLAVDSDTALSRHHCEIDWQAGNYVLRDCRSSNGTWLNGKKLTDEIVPLHFGCRIRLSASTVLTFGLKDVYRFPDLVGCLVNGRYQLEELIRSTPKSALYRGLDQRMRQSVAVKILSPELVNYAGYVQAFTSEAETAVAMRHPHIARALDYGAVNFAMKDGKTFASQFICMEYLNGGSLESRIGEGRVARPAEVAQWLESLSDALDYAHRRGIVHGGLKSNSIVFDEESRAFLMDFTSVAHAMDGHSTVSIGGAPDFMAPEQWEGQKPTPLTDQYSLGILVFTALTGCKPFVGQIDPMTRSRNFEKGPPCLHEEAIRQGNSEVGPNLTAVVERALSLSPDSRFPDVRAFCKEFTANLKPGEVKPREVRVFLSYRRESSSGWAQLFSRLLSARDISFFIDTAMRDRVVRFPKFLEERIKECDVFVCLLAENTLESDWVLREIRLAAKHKRPMVPVYQEGFKIAEAQKRRESGVRRLLNFDGLKLFDRENEYIDAVMNLLEKKIKNSFMR